MKFLFTLVYYNVILLTTVQASKVSLLSVEYCQLLLKFVYIFVKNVGWVVLRLKIGPF
jgi:hypothetical protein